MPVIGYSTAFTSVFVATVLVVGEAKSNELRSLHAEIDKIMKGMPVNDCYGLLSRAQIRLEMGTSLQDDQSGYESGKHRNSLSPDDHDLFKTRADMRIAQWTKFKDRVAEVANKTIAECRDGRIDTRDFGEFEDVMAEIEKDTFEGIFVRTDEDMQKIAGNRPWVPLSVSTKGYNGKVFVTGELRRTRTGWIEKNSQMGKKEWRFETVRREPGTDELHDKSRDLYLKLDFRTRQVTWRTGKSPTWNTLYSIEKISFGQTL